MRSQFPKQKGLLMTNRKNLFLLAIASTTLASSVGAAAQKPAEPRLPYTAVHAPQFNSASEATFLHDPDRVIGVRVWIPGGALRSLGRRPRSFRG